MNYLGKFSLSNAELCHPLKKWCQQESSRCGSDNTKRCMSKPNPSSKPKYAWSFVMRKSHYTVRHQIRSRSSASQGWNVVPKVWGTLQCSTAPVAFASKRWTSIETRYSNTLSVLAVLKITLMYACVCIYCYVQITAIYSKCTCLYIQWWCTLVD